MLSRLKGIETRICDSLVRHVWSHFGYAFPFEGNGNGFTSANTCVNCPSLDMLSRLKGIETNEFLSLCTPLHTLDMLSRLKGMETLQQRAVPVSEKSFGYAFPFEGN